MNDFLVLELENTFQTPELWKILNNTKYTLLFDLLNRFFWSVLNLYFFHTRFLLLMNFYFFRSFMLIRIMNFLLTFFPWFFRFFLCFRFHQIVMLVFWGSHNLMVGGCIYLWLWILLDVTIGNHKTWDLLFISKLEQFILSLMVFVSIVRIFKLSFFFLQRKQLFLRNLSFFNRRLMFLYWRFLLFALEVLNIKSILLFYGLNLSLFTCLRFSLRRTLLFKSRHMRFIWVVQIFIQNSVVLHISKTFP